MKKEDKSQSLDMSKILLELSKRFSLLERLAEYDRNKSK